jgi:hypothetical protein
VSIAVDLTDFVARDTVRRVAPLGVRFWDAAMSRPVADGLVVRYVWTQEPRSWARDSKSTVAVVNNDAVWVLSDLPGLRDLEFGFAPELAGAEPGTDTYWAKVAEPTLKLARTYRIEVRDLLNRFLPFTFEAKLPHRGLFELPPEGGTSPVSPLDAAPAALPLFSQPARPSPPGAGVVRAQLAEQSSPLEEHPSPAAWALLEVSAPGAPPVLGLSDPKGGVVVFYPYPEPSATSGSPPSGRARPLAQESWDLQISCRYGRCSPPDTPPDLLAVLDQPPAALELESSPLGDVPRLAFGRELVLKSPGRSDLLVSPPTSPP